jgi:CubicO group peptidase (beta-lactamase class C family)
MKKFLIILLISQWWILPANSQNKRTPGSSANESEYFPPAGVWEHRSPDLLGLDSVRLEEAIHFARTSESRLPRSQDLAQAITFGKEPFSDPVGPLSDRGDQTGIIIYRGYIVAEWGNPLRVDMANSVTKSMLSSVIGLAVEAGLIRSVYDTIAGYLPPVEIYDPLHISRTAESLGQPELLQPFNSPHNRTLTWDVMLRQTSDWEGTLWGKPDWADRPDNHPEQWLTRKRNEPGAVWKYNDTRVNALALAATCVWRRPLPEILRERIMNPIGASNTWIWAGYRNAWIVLDGRAIQSVSGGGHYGGGLFINAYDMARFGLLTLHKGNWDGKQVIPAAWIKQALTPTSANTGYGYMNWFLNTDRKLFPDAPASAFAHIGNGTNLIYVDPEHNLVAVVRWIENDAINGFIKRLLPALGN